MLKCYIFNGAEEIKMLKTKLSEVKFEILLTLTNLFKPSAVINAPLVANTYDLAT